MLVGKNGNPEIKSIIAFDLETTGIPQFDNNRTRITELALVGCEISHCVDNSIPRVIHKLVLCINPQKKISHGASNCSGLSNELLEEVQPFNHDVVTTLRIFVERLPPPVCLVAHNGNKFDFPILRKELLKCSKTLPDQLYCVDSLMAFKALFPKPVKPKPAKIYKELGSKDDDVVCLDALESYERQMINESTPTKKTMQTINETTPKNKMIPRHPLLFHEDAEITQSLKRVKLHIDTPPSSSSKLSLRSIHILEDLMNHAPKPKTCVEPLVLSPKTFKLKDIYHFLHGEYFSDAHRAENDALALLSCIVKCKEQFCKWMHENAVLLNLIDPLF